MPIVYLLKMSSVLVDCICSLAVIHQSSSHTFYDLVLEFVLFDTEVFDFIDYRESECTKNIHNFDNRF